MPLPSVDIALSLEDYVRVVCAILDIPVYEGCMVESLHVLFTLYLEFKNNQVLTETTTDTLYFPLSLRTARASTRCLPPVSCDAHFSLLHVP